VGDASTALLADLQRTIRDRLGEPARVIPNTADVMVQECARQWPMRAMLRLAKNQATKTAGRETIAAVNVCAAKCREELEYRWGYSPSTDRAIGLLMRAVVVEFANLWFRDQDTRLNLCRIIAVIRKSE
jgi:hypothetical protein